MSARAHDGVHRCNSVYACVCTRACLWVRAAPQYSYDYVQIAQYYNKTSSQAMWLQLDDYNDDKDGSGDDDSVCR